METLTVMERKRKLKNDAVPSIFNFSSSTKPAYRSVGLSYGTMPRFQASVRVVGFLDGGLNHPVVFTVQCVCCLISAIEQHMVSEERS